ncbi:MAG: ATP-binding protein [Pseudomonadota bacterium]
MSIHKSSVNFQNLIRDLAEMYPFEVPVTVVVEILANALDSNAGKILIDYDDRSNILTIVDNGKGMDINEFKQYHDFAAGLKKRGGGIGFAGVGAKISFNVANRVITETRSKSFSGGSNWYLHSDSDLVWENIEPTKLQNYGTRIEVHFKDNIKIPFSSMKDIVDLIKRHYLPLTDPKFLALYEKLHLYSQNLRFIVNGHEIKPQVITDSFELEKVKEFLPERNGKIFGYGVLGVSKKEYPVGNDACGVFLCTHGKVIKADFFNQFPGSLGPQIFGVVEIPEFVNFLTTAKTDFIHIGKYREFEKLYDPIRQTFKLWLKEIGIQIIEATEKDEAKKIEQELKKIITDIPELSNFFGFRTKGQGPLSGPSGPGHIIPVRKRPRRNINPISRNAGGGPKIQFTSTPEKIDLAWIEGNTVIVNTGHSSYKKLRSDPKPKRVHCLFAIAAAIQKFLNSEKAMPDLTFMDRMMSAWGKK